jgi:hypothetical protein
VRTSLIEAGYEGRPIRTWYQLTIDVPAVLDIRVIDTRLKGIPRYKTIETDPPQSGRYGGRRKTQRRVSAVGVAIFYHLKLKSKNIRRIRRHLWLHEDKQLVSLRQSHGGR